MKCASAARSGVVLVVPEEGDALTPDALVRACHSILDAAAALVMNVEMMAADTGQTEEGRAVADDARTSVDRIAKVARALQAAARSRTKVA